MTSKNRFFLSELTHKLPLALLLILVLAIESSLAEAVNDTDYKRVAARKRIWSVGIY